MTGSHVLVGVDGSAPSLAALDLAAAEAKLRSCPLLVLHVDQREGADRVVRAALDRVGSADPDLKVTGEVLAGDVAPVLVTAQADAVVAVVGDRGAGGFAELLLGSVSTQLAAHAHCPVVVARGTARGDQIVVAVDGSARNDPAIGFAFAEARLRAAPVLAVHAVAPPQFSGPSDALIFDARDEEARAISTLYHAVQDWHERFPDLRVQRRVRWAAPVETLVKASASARMIVVGRRGRGAVTGPRLGGVCHALLHHAACPIVVVPADT